MERVPAIVNKLKELVDNNADGIVLLAIAEMLVKELQQIKSLTNNNSPVSVVAPRKVVDVSEIIEKKKEINEDPIHYVLEMPNEEEEKEYIPILIEEKTEQTNENLVHVEEKVKEGNKPFEHSPLAFLFDTTPNIPTLQTQQVLTKPLPEELYAIEEVDVNSKLKEHKVEVAHLLENTHIKDLKKAISINDRYLFINELFMGDEDMYDRIIKTIQGFSILPEATFWIARELKTKLCWPTNNEVVELFDQFVKRRFS